MKEWLVILFLMFSLDIHSEIINTHCIGDVLDYIAKPYKRLSIDDRVDELNALIENDVIIRSLNRNSQTPTSDHPVAFFVARIAEGRDEKLQEMVGMSKFIDDDVLRKVKRILTKKFEKGEPITTKYLEKEIDRLLIAYDPKINRYVELMNLVDSSFLKFEVTTFVEGRPPLYYINNIIRARKNYLKNFGLKVNSSQINRARKIIEKRYSEGFIRKQDIEQLDKFLIEEY